jgi:hypothetical protein
MEKWVNLCHLVRFMSPLKTNAKVNSPGPTGLDDNMYDLPHGRSELEALLASSNFCAMVQRQSLYDARV